MISIRNLLFAYASGVPILENFGWEVSQGEAWAIIGPSGCGKSTLLMLMAGLRRPTSGQVLVHGQILDRPRPETGLILQDYGLLPWATVRENVALGLRIRNFYGPDGKHAPVKALSEPMSTRVDQWLARLNIGHVAGQYPNQVSGGQRQRAAIARTLVLQPDLLLMDEPFGALDALTREDLQQLTLDLRAEHGLTTVIVTHNIEEAVAMGQSILVMHQPPNREPLVVENPAAGSENYRSSSVFFERCNHLRALLGEGNHALA